MNLQDAFLKALAVNEDDTNTRLVYADWLEEHGEHEEADRQRKWQAAKEWLVRFCTDNNPPRDYEDPYEWGIPYAELIERGRTAIEDADERGVTFFYCGNNESMCDALRSNSQAFWRNWSIVTGIPVPPDVEVKSYFSCAC